MGFVVPHTVVDSFTVRHLRQKEVNLISFAFEPESLFSIQIDDCLLSNPTIKHLAFSPAFKYCKRW